eukprot:gene5264-6959_t
MIWLMPCPPLSNRDGDVSSTHPIEKQLRAGILASGERRKRRLAAAGIGSDRSQECRELVRRTRIEAAPGSTRHAGQFAIGGFGDGVMPLLKNEQRYPEDRQLAGRHCKVVERLLHGIADKNDGLNPPQPCLGQCVRQNPSDLRMATAAINSTHDGAEAIGIRHPARSA